MTQFAPAERLSYAEVLKQSASLQAIKYLKSIVDALHQPVIIMNHERQIVVANTQFLKLTGAQEPEVINGLRYGETIQCIHAQNTYGGCGTSASCSVCGAVNAILETQTNSTPCVRECNITVLTAHGAESLELEIATNPIVLDEYQYVLASLTDTTDAKRRHILERIFFHDVLNTTSGISNLLSCIIDEEDPAEQKEHLNLILESSVLLVNQIVEQKELLAAESGELTPRLISCDSTSVITSVMGRFQDQRSHRVLVGDQNASIDLVTDRTLLERTLDNMVKNALEASKNNDPVTIYCKELPNRQISFSVHNRGVMPPEVQLSIFKRSFSTKAKDRGLGTYSIKLLTERYLKGTVGFTSTEAAGTTFTITLPQSV